MQARQCNSPSPACISYHNLTIQASCPLILVIQPVHGVLHSLPPALVEAIRLRLVHAGLEAGIQLPAAGELLLVRPDTDSKTCQISCTKSRGLRDLGTIHGNAQICPSVSVDMILYSGYLSNTALRFGI